MHTVTKLALAMIGAAVVFSFTLPAQAQQQCAPDRDSALNHLAEKYGERIAGDFYILIDPIASNTGAVVEITRNEDTATWTMIATGLDGRTCVVAEGIGFGSLPPKSEEGVNG